MIRQKITPCLWFDGQAEEAANFYTSVFPDSVITSAMPGPGGKALVVTFHLSGVEFMALNGGPEFKFTEAVSFSIDCQTQAEVDHFWEKLLAGGSAMSCGWLKDRFGLAWQVIPKALPRLLTDPDRAKAGRVMQAMMGMVKLDVAALEAAAEAKQSS